MKCPYCSYSDDRVLDTREQKDGVSIRRRRECLECKARFSTLETISLSLPYVIKKDGRREPYSREKILKGLQAACQKRPVSLNQLEGIVERITAWVMGRTERELPSRMIGQKLMMELRLLDDVAYVRFASVYRTFKDVQEFVETLEDQEAFEVYDPQVQLPLTPEKAQNETTIPRTRPADSVSN
jgi:transcriptional repressor NrdR